MLLIDFGLWLLLPTIVNIPKKLPSTVATEIQKLKKKGISDSEIVNHHLEIYGLTKPAFPKNSVKENGVRFIYHEELPLIKLHNPSIT